MHYMHTPEDADLDARLSDVEQRLARIEADANGPARPGAAQPVPLDPTTAFPRTTHTSDFFALEGVKQSMPDGGVVYAGAVPTAAGPVEWQIGLPFERVMETDWSTVAPALAALGHPVRIRLLQAILAGATTVTELGALDEIGTTGQLYHHLGQLTAAGWIRTERRGHYAVPADRVVPALVIVTAAGRL